MVPTEQIPPPSPPQPTTTMGFKPEDFSPMNPAHPIAIDLYQQLSGKTISPEAIAQARALAMGLQADLAAQAAADAEIEFRQRKLKVNRKSEESSLELCDLLSR